MAVYTPISQPQLLQFLAQFELGQLTHYQGIEGGIENTNYFVTLEQEGAEHEYVLTLFEEFAMDEVPFFVELTTWLAARGVPVPAPFKDRNGIALKKLCNKPALLQPRFSGTHVQQQALTAQHCASIGYHLAHFHRAGEQFYLRRQAHRGVFWWRRESQSIARHLSTADADLLHDEVQRFDQLRQQPWGLPMGTIHGDLFHDNVLFNGTEVSAILDIYNAASAFLLFDLAIVANDWCCHPDGSIDPEREQALLLAYQAERPFSEHEYTAWSQMTCTAAMRFWLSRLIPACGLQQASRDHQEMIIKDPDELKRILLFRRANPARLP